MRLRAGCRAEACAWKPNAVAKCLATGAGHGVVIGQRLERDVAQIVGLAVDEATICASFTMSP